MRWVNEDGSTRSGPWVEPIDHRSSRVDTCSARFVFAVPTQEGMALQLNSMLSVLTLGARLRRVAVVMPLFAGGPHYRGEVALRRLAITTRMSTYVNVNSTAGTATRWVEFEDVAEFLPRSAPCVSCAGRPPPHVRCPRGWDYAWCNRNSVERFQSPKCSLRLARHADECAVCVFSVGFTPGLQRAVPAWRIMREQLRFADAYEIAAAHAATSLFGQQPFAALQMRRGDKSAFADRAGLTVDSVLTRTRKLVPNSMPILVATDDRSNITLAKVDRAGFAIVTSALLNAILPQHITVNSIAAYIIDILLCVKARVFVGTAHKHKKSKQLDLIKALRRGRWRSSADSSWGGLKPRDHILT